MCSVPHATTTVRALTRNGREGLPMSPPRILPATPVARPRSISTRSTSASEMTRAPWCERIRQVRNVDRHLGAARASEVAAPVADAAIGVAAKRAHRNAEPIGSSDELLGPERAHLDGHFATFTRFSTSRYTSSKAASEKSTSPRSLTHCS